MNDVTISHFFISSESSSITETFAQNIFHDKFCSLVYRTSPPPPHHIMCVNAMLLIYLLRLNYFCSMKLNILHILFNAICVTVL